MIRISLVTVLTMAGAANLAIPSQANNQPWHKHSEASRIAVSEGKWNRACRQAILAGAMKDKAGSLSTEYMAKIGNRCTKAGL